MIDQKDLRKEADHLWSLGHEITGSWLQEVTKPDCMDEETFNRKLAIKDIAEVTAAELIILDNRQSSGGKNNEWGIGLAQHQHKLLWLVGEPTNVFHYLADDRFTSWASLIEHLKQEAA
jgi:hypothetical protein